MARASGLSYEQLAHATAWYLREETLTAATDEVVNYHHRLPAAQLWGEGTFSSSDGQRFPVPVKAVNAGALPRYFGFGRGISGAHLGDRSLRHLWDQGDSHPGPGGPLRPRRDLRPARPRLRALDHRAHHRHRRLHRLALRSL